MEYEEGPNHVTPRSYPRGGGVGVGVVISSDQVINLPWFAELHVDSAFLFRDSRAYHLS